VKRLPKYRLYVDEVGNSDLKSSHDPNHRYLSLTGVIIDLAYVRDVLHDEMERLKREFFGDHPDEPVILHRKQLVNRRYPFAALRDPLVERAFNARILQLLEQWEYVAITIVIDKLRHLEQYQVWRYDPYHYCLEVLLERYVLWLQDRMSCGDVMAESRGGKEDRRLKTSFARLYTEGSDYIPADRWQRRLTSTQLKVKPKAANVSGLQLADLIAHPSYRATRARRNNEALPANFGGQIAKILEASKYRRSPHGQIDRWGRKWLP